MRKARRFISWKKQVFLVGFSLTFPKFSTKSKNQLQHRPEVFCVKGVLRNLTKFTGKHLCQILVFNKVAGLRAIDTAEDRTTQAKLFKSM